MTQERKPINWFILKFKFLARETLYGNLGGKDKPLLQGLKYTSEMGFRV